MQSRNQWFPILGKLSPFLGYERYNYDGSRAQGQLLCFYNMAM